MFRWFRILAVKPRSAARTPTSPCTAQRDGLRALHRAEARARQFLKQGKPHDALHEIEHHGEPTSSMRLLRNVCLLLIGRRVDAHVDLREWASHSCCPMSARVLLGLAELDRGEHTNAVRAWAMNLDQIDDVRTIRAMMLACAEAGYDHAAGQWAQQMFTHASAWLEPIWDATARSVLSDEALSTLPDEPPLELVAHLTEELRDNEPVIASLVVAVEREPMPRRAMLLKAALRGLIDAVKDRQSLFEALARLSVTAGDDAEARYWARRGLGEFPLSSALALVMAEIGSGQVRRRLVTPITAAGKTTHANRQFVIEEELSTDEQVRVFDVIIKAHPDWPDIQRARRALDWKAAS